MISYRFVPISSQKRVLFFETPGSFTVMWQSYLNSEIFCCKEKFQIACILFENVVSYSQLFCTERNMFVELGATSCNIIKDFHQNSLLQNSHSNQ